MPEAGLVGCSERLSPPQPGAQSSLAFCQRRSQPPLADIEHRTPFFFDPLQRIQIEGGAGQGGQGGQGSFQRRLGQPQGGVLLWLRKDLEGDLCQHTQAAQAADQQFGQVKTRCIFDHLPSPPHQPALPVDKADAEQKVADPAVAIPAGAAQPGRHGAAQGGALVDPRRVEGKVLAVLGQSGSDRF